MPTTPKGKTRKKTRFPPGWDAKRIRRILAHYEEQSEEEAVAEDEAAFEDPRQAVILAPREVVPAIRELIANLRAA